MHQYFQPNSRVEELGFEWASQSSRSGISIIRLDYSAAQFDIHGIVRHVGTWILEWKWSEQAPEKNTVARELQFQLGT